MFNGCIESGLFFLELYCECEVGWVVGEDGYVCEVYVFIDLVCGVWLWGIVDVGWLSWVVEECLWLGGVYVVDMGVVKLVNIGIVLLDFL